MSKNVTGDFSAIAQEYEGNEAILKKAEAHHSAAQVVLGIKAFYLLAQRDPEIHRALLSYYEGNTAKASLFLISPQPGLEWTVPLTFLDDKKKTDELLRPYLMAANAKP